MHSVPKREGIPVAKKAKKPAVVALETGNDKDLKADGANRLLASDLGKAEAPAPIVEQEASDELLRQELSEVRELARSLSAAVQEVRSQSARNETLRSALQDVKSDVRAAQQAALMAPPMAAAAAPYVDPHGGQREGKCGPCECVSDGCCCFDIKIWQVRAAKPQVEPADMGDTGPFINPLEVQMYFTVDDIGFLWPGLGSTIDLRVEGLPTPGPGAWLVVGRAVNRICLPKGTTKTAVLRAWCREHDEGIERPIGMKDEIGEGMGMITLDCCMEKIYPPMPIEISLDQGGKGGGMVQVAFYAERVCC